MKEGCELFLKTSDCELIWDRYKSVMLIVENKKVKTTIEQEYWMDYEQFFEHVFEQVKENVSLTLQEHEQLKTAIELFLKNPRPVYYTEGDIRYFTHMSYIAGVQHTLDKIDVDDVDCLTEHLIELYPQFQKELGAVFYEKVGEFAEKNLKKEYVLNTEEE